MNANSDIVELVHEIPDLREGFLADLHRRQVGAPGLPEFILKRSKTVDGRSVRRSRRRNESVLATKE
jgi:hypothetical protein